MSFVVTAQFVPLSGQQELVAQHLVELARHSRQEPGCEHYEVHRSVADPPTFLVYERYANSAAFDFHRSTGHFQTHVLDGIIPACADRSSAKYEILPDAQAASSPQAPVALVLGGGHGINRATCEQLAAQGFCVAVADVDTAAADTVAAELHAGGARSMSIPVEMADSSTVAAAVDAAIKEFGQLDVLVTGAGHAEVTPFEQLSDETIDRMLAVHLKGTITAVRSAVPAMRRRGYGRIVCISSAAAVKGSANHHHYAAANAGITGFVRSIAPELAPHGITINAVLPGPIETRMITAMGAEQLAKLAAATPVGRLGTPADVARAVAFLAAPDSGFITGVSLIVAGGGTV